MRWMGAASNRDRSMSISNASRFLFQLPAAVRSGGPAVIFLYKGCVIFLIWTVIGLFLSVPEQLRGFQGPYFVAKLIEYWAWAFLTPVILYADRKLAQLGPKPLLHAGILLVLTVPFSFAHVYISALMLYPIPAIWWNPLRSPDFVVYYFLGGWLASCAIIGMLQAFRYYRSFLAKQVELQRVEMRLLQSHLNTLRMQLEPHFLFNALNAISSVVASNPELARDMIEDLGALLRLSLDYKDNVEIPLADEIVLLEHYLAIQRVRFGDRVRIEIAISSDMMSVLVPCMLLQPIVENSIRHGISSRISGGRVAVSATRVGDIVEITVEDDGVGLPFGWRPDQAKGLGVRVTRERLAGLYPDIAGSFEIRNRAAGGTLVVMRVPLRTVEMDDDEQATV